MTSLLHDPTPDAPVAELIGFVQALRAAGIGAWASEDFLAATALLELGSAEDVYWAGRATLCGSPDDVPLYDEVFGSWFRVPAPGVGHPPPFELTQNRPRSRTGVENEGGPGDDTEVVPIAASVAERLAHRDIADLDAAEAQAVASAFAALRPRPPMRTTRRHRPSRRGDIDMGRSAREQLRHGGEPALLRYHERASKPRRVVWLIDVSGSMKVYADSYLRLAHRGFAGAPRTTEVFTFGTRLTRVTPAFAHPDAETALRTAGEIVPDWSGGTRLGEMMRAFCDRWGQRGPARGAVVVVCSDGWERGDPALLGEQMARLRRIAHRLVWVNPHREKPDYAPVQSGIVSALPAIDELIGGHSFATLARVHDVVAEQ
ncbi:vWA domain-containing protein [Aeromicrobium piscarium]|uniref:VWA domain-containing protein n=1 Tax=Aeromicrobium piscarium TaxID=2590901 RepID=A0A554SNV3_9ACTN|nr:VWA domain-containing protein [Aeromicrobium piscarium]TSD68041.1 VWA domain-containing protein [Aeromicrobium piscarium]